MAVETRITWIRAGVRSRRGTARRLSVRRSCVMADQGLGDTIQFIRLAPLVQQRGGRVLAEVQPPLRQILSTAPGIDQLLVRGDETPPFDTYDPALQLAEVRCCPRRSKRCRPRTLPTRLLLLWLTRGATKSGRSRASKSASPGRVAGKTRPIAAARYLLFCSSRWPRCRV